MNSIKKIISYRKSLLTSILVITFLVIIAIFAGVIYLVESENKQHLENSTLDWANTLAQANINLLVENPMNARITAKTRLQQLMLPSFINHIHIYKEVNGEVTYFTDYNKSVYSPSIPDKIDKLEELSRFKYQNSYLEKIIKIQHNEKVVGYLYIQASTENIEDLRNKLIFIGIFFLVIALFMFIILSHKMSNKVNLSIDILVNRIHEITQNNNFTTKIEQIPLIELDVLAQNINTLLKKTEKLLISKDEKLEQTLLQNTKLVEKVQTRTSALKDSNKELLSTLEKLHQFQDELVETEKMASLGDMVAGIAHEVNTPLGLGVTASTLLSDQLTEIKRLYEDKTLRSSQLRKFLLQGEENIGIIYRNLDRAAQLISNFKKVAVDQSNIDILEFNVSNLLEEVRLTLKTKLHKNNIELIIDCPDDLNIESKPGPISQILVNFIINSIVHGFENKPNGIININVVYLSDQLHIRYRDNGIGIDESIKEKIFDPFTTTKRGSGGSGLGLHLVFNIVTQALNGQIYFESKSTTGAEFNISFPAINITNNKLSS